MFKLIVALACVLAGSTVAAADAPPSALRRSLLTRRAGKPTDGALLDPSPNGGCDCVGDSCQCCEHISSKKVRVFDSTLSCQGCCMSNLRVWFSVAVFGVSVVWL